MEQMFAGPRIRDAVAPHRYARGARGSRRGRSVTTAAALAVSALVLLGGVAYGGASSGPQQVVVQRGDTLWAIARSHYPGDSVQERVASIEAANHLSGAWINPGQTLILPAP